MNIYISGKVEKVSTRDGYRVVLRSTSKNVIADFADTPNPKIRVNQTIAIFGRVRSEGRDTICLNDCRRVSPMEVLYGRT